MPFPSNAVHQIPSHTHTINKPSIYDAYGFRIDPLKEEELEDGGFCVMFVKDMDILMKLTGEE